MKTEKICPFLQKECIKKNCMAWDRGCLLINKIKNTPAHKSEHPTKLINAEHNDLVQLLQKLAIKKRSKLESTTLEDIYLSSIGFKGILPKEPQRKLDKAVNEAMKDILDQMCPGYFITSRVEEIAERMFKWIVENLDLSDIWDCQQKYLKEHNINEFKLSFNSEIFKKYNKAIIVLRNRLTAYKDDLIRIRREEEELTAAFDNVVFEVRKKPTSLSQEEMSPFYNITYPIRSKEEKDETDQELKPKE